MEEFDFKSLKTGKEFFNHPVTELARNNHHGHGDSYTSIKYYDDADAYFVRIILNDINFEDVCKSIQENLLSKSEEEFIKQLDEDKVNEKYRLVLMKNHLEREEPIIKKDVDKLNLFTCYLSREFGEYVFSRPRQPRFAIYSEELEDVLELLKTGVIKSVKENGVETVRHSKISIKPSQLREMFGFAYKTIPFMNEFEERLSGELELEFLHFSELENYFKKINSIALKLEDNFREKNPEFIPGTF